MMPPGGHGLVPVLRTRQSPVSPGDLEIGALLVEPQWGPSGAAMPWPADLPKAHGAEARSRGIPVVADEIMCGIGRHCQGACFLTECWDFDVDVVTFGKAMPQMAKIFVLMFLILFIFALVRARPSNARRDGRRRPRRRKATPRTRRRGSGVG